MAVGQALGYKLKVLALFTKFYVLIYVLSFIFNEFHFSIIEEKMGHRGRWNPAFCDRLIFTQIF